MRRMIIVILSVSMLGCSVNVCADATGMYLYEGVNEQGSSDEEKAGITIQESFSDSPYLTVDGEEVKDDFIENEKMIVDGAESEPGEAVSGNDQAQEDEFHMISGNDEAVISINDIILDGENENNMLEEVGDGPLEEAEDVSISENEAQTVSGGDREKGIGSQPDDDVISKVEIPTKVHVKMDVDKVTGKGDIFSKGYEIVNHGNRDIAVKIKNIKFSYRFPQELYVLSENMTIDEDPEKKKIDVDMIWENEDEDQKKVVDLVDGKLDEYVIYLKAAKYDKNGKFKKLNEGSKGIFRFEGILEADPNLEWTDNEISLSLDYEIVNMGEEEDRQGVDEFIENAQALLEDDIQPNETSIVEENNEGVNVENGE